MLNHYMTLALIGFLAAITVLERHYPDQELKQVPSWWKRVLTLQVLVAVFVNVGLALFEKPLNSFTLLSGRAVFNPFFGGVFTYLVGTFVFYWWHRLRHESDLLWRLLHQMHHSPSRIQAVSAFYVHPLEVVASSALNAVLVLVVFGLSKESLAWNSSFMAVAGIFYHMNLKTPHWVGNFVQRPEMHRYHHELGVHARNYGDVPWWDMIFKTHHNPRDFRGTCGFEGDRELRFAEMLLAIDVHAEPKVKTRDSRLLDTNE